MNRSGVLALYDTGTKNCKGFWLSLGKGLVRGVWHSSEDPFHHVLTYEIPFERTPQHWVLLVQPEEWTE